MSKSGGKVAKGDYDEYFKMQDGKFVCVIPDIKTGKPCGGTCKTRSDYVRHLRVLHKEEHAKGKGELQIIREDTPEDVLLSEDFSRHCGLTTDMGLQKRKYFAFYFNKLRMILDFAYMKLDGRAQIGAAFQLLKHASNVVDHELPVEYQVGRDEFKRLPDGQEQGHALAKRFFSYAEEMLLVPYLNSITAPQDGTFNREHWDTLESMVLILNIKYDVRIIAGNYGAKDDEGESVLDTPTHWYMIIVVEDRTTHKFKYDAYLFPNDPCHTNLAEYRVDIADIWFLTGYDFFYPLSRDMQKVDLAFEGKHLMPKVSATIKNHEEELAKEKEKSERLMKQLDRANKRCRDLEEDNTKLKCGETEAVMLANKRMRHLEDEILQLQCERIRHANTSNQ